MNWSGSANPTEHTFHNTDRFLREQGYALCGLTFRRYSRTALPAPFEYGVHAQTRFGQPYQGDAIYVRDLVAPYHEELADAYRSDKLVKLACIYELIGLPDRAAEVLERFRPRLGEFGDTEELLDALTPPLLGERLCYREYITRFERYPRLFLPSAETTAETPTPQNSTPMSDGAFGFAVSRPERRGRLAAIRDAARGRFRR